MSFGGFQMPVVCLTLVLCNSLSPVLVSASFRVGGLLKNHRCIYLCFLWYGEKSGGVRFSFIIDVKKNTA